MHNKTMEHALKQGTCLDVNDVGKPHDGFEGFVWELKEVKEDTDYCDAIAEHWIYSIGKRKRDGRIFAAIDNRFHDNPMFELLWLR